MALTEEFKEIDGYEGRYIISNLGIIKSINRTYITHRGGIYTKKAKVLKTRISRKYLQVVLVKNGEFKNYSVHRLVAINFISNPENKPEINHIDGNKLNNNIDNLEWCTHSENMIHAFKTGLKKGRKGIKNHNAKLTDIQVLEIRAKYKPYKYTQTRLALEYNIDQSIISEILNNKRWQHLLAA